MSKFYTNVALSRNNILVRGYEDGKKVQYKVPYKPYMFTSTTTTSKYHTVDKKMVGRIDFDSISSAREFIKQYQYVENFKLYGLTNFIYTFINDDYYGEINYDPSLVSVVTIDIEVDSVGGFPILDQANKEITLITISKNGYKSVFGCGNYKQHAPNIKYYKCKDEYALLVSFLEIWNGVEYSPDVITGWNCEFFDIPYLVNRITKVLGEDQAKKLSPWGFLQETTVEIMGNDNTVYTPAGITILDYMQLYKKFAYTQQESYKLDHIAQEELGEKKLDYSKYGTLADLQVKNWQLYTEYNIHDCDLVDKLDDKLKLIELVMAMAYDAKVNYQDTFTTVRLWDVIIHNHLMKSNTVVHQFEHSNVSRQIIGGYVKDPQIGMHKWVVSLDLNSLYPHIIMQYNISPETYLGKLRTNYSIDDILNGALNNSRDILTENNCTVTANLCLFSREKQGFLPTLMQKMYDDRVVYKNKLLEAKKNYEKVDKKSPEGIQLAKDIARYNNLQMSKKIQLNSGYGALANEWNRWYETDFAEAITASGQLTTRWIENKLNIYLNKILKTSNVDYCIACDTDSVYIKMDKLVEQINETDTDKIIDIIDSFVQKKLEPHIDKCYDELGQYVNCFQQKMKMKRECIADKGIWTAKKHYILNVYNQEGVKYKQPKLKMMGIEAIRTSTPAVCRQAIKQSLEIIMNKTEVDLRNYIDYFRQRFKSMEFEDVAFPRGVKDIEKWDLGKGEYRKGTPIHVKGAIIYNGLVSKLMLDNKYQKIRSGEKIKFCYIIEPNPYRVSVITSGGKLPEEFNLQKYIDYDTQFDKAYLEPIKTITDSIGWKVENLATLEGFFQ